jgi:regulator of protease activity HflC (stomatin/prohibitin superfamily)
MTEKIYIGIDGKRVEAKGEVLEQILKDRAEYQAEQSRIEAETAAKAEARESAMAKLKKLGLTDDEIAALVP